MTTPSPYPGIFDKNQYSNYLKNLNSSKKYPNAATDANIGIAVRSSYTIDQLFINQNNVQRWYDLGFHSSATVNWTGGAVPVVGDLTVNDVYVIQGNASRPDIVIRGFSKKFVQEVVRLIKGKWDLWIPRLKN